MRVKLNLFLTNYPIALSDIDVNLIKELSVYKALCTRSCEIHQSFKLKSFK